MTSLISSVCKSRSCESCSNRKVLTTANHCTKAYRTTTSVRLNWGCPCFQCATWLCSLIRCSASARTGSLRLRPTTSLYSDKSHSRLTTNRSTSDALYLKPPWPLHCNLLRVTVRARCQTRSSKRSWTCTAKDTPPTPILYIPTLNGARSKNI